MSTAPSKSRGFLGRLLFFFKLLEIRLRFVALLVLTGVVIGYWDTLQNHIERWQRTHRAATSDAAGLTTPSADTEWFCPMHPFVLRDRFDQCPICGMNLVERRRSGPTQLPEGVITRVQVSPERILQAGVHIEPAAYRLLSRTVRAYGTIELDETRVAKIIARFPGRVEELMVNATGLEVKTGQPLVRIYSPRFLSAVQEYLQALTAQRDAEKSPALSDDARRRARDLADYARRRLALAGFTDSQLDDIASTGKASEYVAFYSPLAGTVLEKNVLLGQMVDEGTTLYTIADLSTLWIQAQVVEADIGLVKPGMSVEVEAAAYPGELFYGTVDFIYPTLDTETRSVKVRVIVGNRERKLKPGMYVAAVLRAPIGRYGVIGSGSEPPRDDTPTTLSLTAAGASGAPLNFKLPTRNKEETQAFLASIPIGAEYYACPMESESVSDKQDDCPLCGMALESRKKESAASVPITAETPSAERWAEGWTCPMHLDVLMPTSGTCRVCPCGMETLHWRIERQLSVPESAVIDTGNRQIVYVEAMPGVYDARAVTLGPRAGNYYPVLRGLLPGERIVTQGAFLVDAEARLNPAPAAPPPPSTLAERTPSRPHSH